jgi:hypothetical protein
MIARIIPFILFSALLLPLNSFAAGKVTIESAAKGNRYTMEIEYLDNHNLRMNFHRGQKVETYMLIKDNKVYTVTMINNAPMVMDIGAMSQMAGALGGDNSNDSNEASGPLGYEVLSLKATGKKETVAGFTGEVYLVTAKDGTGTSSEEVVFSSDPKVRAYTDAWREAGKTMQQVLARDMATDNDLDHYMEKNKLGLLRYGTQYRVVAIDDKKPAADRFTLPTAPMSMPDFGSMFGGGAK